MKYTLLTLALVATVSGCANQPLSTPDVKATPPGACVTNFVTEGGFWAGQKHSTHEIFQKKSVAGAFDSVLQVMVTSGYQIVSNNKESGLISASQTVSYGNGKTIPINVLIKKISSSDIKVEVSTVFSGGVTAPVDSVQKEFCKFLAAANQSPNISEPTGQQSTQQSPETAANTKKAASTKAKKQSSK